MAIYLPPVSPRACDACGTKLTGRRRDPRPCLCGCGGLTRGGRFRPGHDAKLAKLLHRLAADSQSVVS